MANCRKMLKEWQAPVSERLGNSRFETEPAEQNFKELQYWEPSWNGKQPRFPLAPTAAGTILPQSRSRKTLAIGVIVSVAETGPIQPSRPARRGTLGIFAMGQS